MFSEMLIKELISLQRSWNGH